MKNIETLLETLGHAARETDTPPVDVRFQVLRTLEIRAERNTARSVVPGFAVASLAAAALVLIAVVPQWVSTVDPWGYFLSF